MPHMAALFLVVGFNSEDPYNKQPGALVPLQMANMYGCESGTEDPGYISWPACF
jgi:hypothetical protein